MATTLRGDDLRAVSPISITGSTARAEQASAASGAAVATNIARDPTVVSPGRELSRWMQNRLGVWSSVWA